ncbi:MAG: hypothetical protein WCX31_03525 [Salinivirgaceae bacterium]|jgi:hypothetical protein
MKTAKWIIFIVLFGIGAYFILNQKVPQITNQNTIETDSLKPEVKKRFDENGLLKADVEVLNGVNHGKAHNYYDNGSVHSEISYKYGIKDGNSIWYYENGKPYRITPFKDNRMHGIQQKFYKSGKLMAEIPYMNDSIIEGTKEFSETGQILDEKLPFQIKKINGNNNDQVFIEITSKKKDIIEDAYAKYSFKDKAMISKASIEGKNYLIPISTSGSFVPPVTIIVIYKTKMNNLKMVSSVLN